MEFIPYSCYNEIREIDERIGNQKKKKENNDFILINIYIFPLYFPCIYIVLKILVYIRICMQKMKSLKIHLVIETGISSFFSSFKCFIYILI